MPTVGIFPLRVYSDGTGTRVTTGIKALEAVPWPVLANSGASWPQLRPQPGPAPRVPRVGFPATSGDG
jgi:hypothetical protein